MRNIDLIECAMRRLNLQYDVPFKLLDGKELYKIIKEDNKFIKEINLLFCNEFTHGEFKKIILDLFMQENNIEYGKPFAIKICDYLDVTYKIDINGECFYKITRLDDKWNNVEKNPLDISQVMFNKNITIL